MRPQYPRNRPGVPRKVPLRQPFHVPHPPPGRCRVSFTFICRPISSYPVPETRDRQRARFLGRGRGSGDPNFRGPLRPTPIGQTLDELRRELAYLAARDVVLELDLQEGDLRLDGWPRADARPRTPRVVLSFGSKYGPVRYPCDTFDRWEDNVRAIRLALEALRTVDRYGVTRRGEQYTGWKALPAQSSATVSVEAAAEVLGRFSLGGSRPILLSRDAFQEAHRRARAATHPDRNDGSRASWDAVEAAAAVLMAHHGGAA